MVASIVGVVRPAPAGVRESGEWLLDLLGSQLDLLRLGSHVLVKPNMFQLAPGLQSTPEIVAGAAVGRRARVTVAERTRAIHELLADTGGGRYADVVSFEDRQFSRIRPRRSERFLRSCRPATEV